MLLSNERHLNEYQGVSSLNLLPTMMAAFEKKENQWNLDIGWRFHDRTIDIAKNNNYTRLVPLQWQMVRQNG